MLWIILLVVIVLLWVLVYYNKIKRSEVKVDEALSGIDVALAKRYSVITNLVEVVKGYAKHEREVLSLVTESRQVGRIDYEEGLKKMATRLLMISEAYPDLKADKNFLHLQRALVDTEEHIQASRRLYNANVRTLNELIFMFPGSLINVLAQAKPAQFYEAKGEERVLPEVHFEEGSV